MARASKICSHSLAPSRRAGRDPTSRSVDFAGTAAVMLARRDTDTATDANGGPHQQCRLILIRSARWLEVRVTGDAKTLASRKQWCQSPKERKSVGEG